MNFTRKGSGPPLLLIHGLGGSARSFDPILGALTPKREVVVPDLPGFGDSPPLAGEVSIATLADSIEAFMDEHDLRGVDAAGSSMGARLVLELARRGSVGAVVSLDPGGFWNRREQQVFGGSVALAVSLVRALKPLLPFLTGNPVTRTLLFGQFSARPWALDSGVALTELRSFVAAKSFDEALHALANGPTQEGMPAGTATKPIVIGWGRRDLVCLPRQAQRAAKRFPDAELYWFDKCGHFPQWDSPDEAARLILQTTG